MSKKEVDEIVNKSSKKLTKFVNEVYPEMVCNNCKYFDGKSCSEGEEKEAANAKGHCSVWELGNGEENDEKLMGIYRNLLDILRKYCDIREEYYPLVAIWIMGTYIHDKFETYPYLYFNAMKGSGKSRLLKLITHLSKGGEMLTSPTEAVLFRTTGTLGIDEFEGISRKGGENLRELLNASYKKGNTVKRMKKKKTMEGEEHVVESFEVYRPICLANIWGMENVLGDRCISLILERSNKREITRLIELFKYDEMITTTLEAINANFNEKVGNWCSLCGVYPPSGVYRDWNKYVIDMHLNNTNNTNNIHNIHYTNNTNTLFFNKINSSNIDGRHLELTFPLFIIANSLGEDILDNLIGVVTEIIKDKKDDDFQENYDISLYDFVSQLVEEGRHISVKDITNDFKEFIQASDEWINPKWMGRALKRLNLIVRKRRVNKGMEIIPNIKKAQEKIKMFR